MQGKIGLEEHFAIEETLNDSRAFFPTSVWEEVRGRVLDLHDRRLREMDEHGIEMMMLSLNAPAVQAIPDPAQANEIAPAPTTISPSKWRKRPDRFQGLAALPLQDPDMAAARTATLRQGARLQRRAGQRLLPDRRPRHRRLLRPAAVPAVLGRWSERLDVPFYLHPRNPLPRDASIYEGHRWLLGPIWAFGQETAVHALRLMGSGLFDAYPKLQIVLGHMGEGLPFSMWRVDNCNAWIGTGNTYPAKKKIAEYFQDNFYLTTSGNFRTQALLNAMMEIGADRIMFSTDWPFENIDHAAIWFDDARSARTTAKIGRTNARLFKLGND